LNLLQMLAHELQGVLADVRETGQFDEVCRKTVERVCATLYGITTQSHTMAAAGRWVPLQPTQEMKKVLRTRRDDPQLEYALLLAAAPASPASVEATEVPTLTPDQFYDLLEQAGSAYRRHKASIRGQQCAAADDPQWHLAVAAWNAALRQAAQMPADASRPLGDEGSAAGRQGAPGNAQAVVKWCSHCGEGVIDFCRGKSTECPMSLQRLAHQNNQRAAGAAHTTTESAL